MEMFGWTLEVENPLGKNVKWKSWMVSLEGENSTQFHILLIKRTLWILKKAGWVWTTASSHMLMQLLLTYNIKTTVVAGVLFKFVCFIFRSSCILVRIKITSFDLYFLIHLYITIILSFHSFGLHVMDSIMFLNFSLIPI